MVKNRFRKSKAKTARVSRSQRGGFRPSRNWLYKSVRVNVVLLAVVVFTVAGLGTYSVEKSHADAWHCVYHDYGLYNAAAHWGGYCVKDIQTMLNHEHYPGMYQLTVDGEFGNNTNNNVVVFQRYQGLGVDGIVGPHTWWALCDLNWHSSSWYSADCNLIN